MANYEWCLNVYDQYGTQDCNIIMIKLLAHLFLYVYMLSTKFFSNQFMAENVIECGEYEEAATDAENRTHSFFFPIRFYELKT